jgi:hypothetical protein
MFKNCLWSLKYDLYNQRDNAFSKNQLRLADKLRKITLAVVNLLRDHSIIDVKKTLEAVETKSSNSRTDKIEIKYSDRFNREAVAISKKLDKLMKDARWKQI